MPDGDSGNILVIGLLAIGGYVVWKTIGTASNEAEDFANIPQDAGNAAVNGVSNIVDDIWSGAVDVTGGVGTGTGDVVNDVLAIPGDGVKAAQDTVGGAVDAVTNWEFTGF